MFGLAAPLHDSGALLTRLVADYADDAYEARERAARRLSLSPM